MKYPITLKSKTSGIVYKFIDETRGYVVEVPAERKTDRYVGQFYDDLVPAKNSDRWKPYSPIWCSSS